MALLDELQRADRLQATALADLEAGRPSRAERRVLRVLGTLDRLPLTPDVDQLRVRSLLSLASARADLRSVDDGLQVLVQAATVVERTGDPTMQAMWDLQHAWLMLGAGRPRDALPSFNAAVAELPRLSPHNGWSALNGRAFAHSELHDVELARVDWAACAALAGAAGLSDLQFAGLHNLAWADFLSGDLPRSLAGMDQAAKMDVVVDRGVVKMDRARVLTEAGLIDEADRALAEAEAEFARMHTSLEHALAELARAECALLAADPVRAGRFAARAARRLRRRGSDSLARTADLIALQAHARSRSRREKLADKALALRTELAAAGQEAHARLAGLLGAELLVDEGRLGEARALLTREVRLRPSDRIGHRLQGRVAATKLALAENDSRAARRAIRRGVQDIADHQAIFGGIDLRTAAAVHGRRLAALDLDLALADGRPDRVFDAVEQARAVSSRLPPVRPPEDDEAAALMTELRAVVEQGRDGGAADNVALARRRVEIEARISALGWAQSAGVGERAVRPAVMRDIRDRLTARDTVMVAFARSASTLHAIVLGEGRTRVVDLGRAAQIRERITRVRADLDALAGRALPPVLQRSVSGALDHDLAGLDDAALRPLHLGGKRLVVVAGGAVSTVPWGNLPSLCGVPVSVSPSATWWAHAVDDWTPARPGDMRVTALSGPALTRAAGEAADVAAQWEHGSAITGPQATVQALGTALAEADLVHVAAHGHHEPQNPLFSSVRMSDGLLFAHELTRRPVRASQVVLSACDVGMVTVRPGDEALGLTSVLLNVGPRTVVASVSRLSDDVAHGAMVGYHRTVAAGVGPADAVARMVSEDDGRVPLVCFGIG